MSEFIELAGETVVRKSDMAEVLKREDGTCCVVMQSGCEYEIDEPYESIRDNLLGKPAKAVVVDRREGFVEQLLIHFRNEGLFAAANRIDTFYHSMVLSETEGAG